MMTEAILAQIRKIRLARARVTVPVIGASSFDVDIEFERAQREEQILRTVFTEHAQRLTDRIEHGGVVMSDFDYTDPEAAIERALLQVASEKKRNEEQAPDYETKGMVQDVAEVHMLPGGFCRPCLPPSKPVANPQEVTVTEVKETRLRRTLITTTSCDVGCMAENTTPIGDTSNEGCPLQAAALNQAGIAMANAPDIRTTASHEEGLAPPDGKSEVSVTTGADGVSILTKPAALITTLRNFVAILVHCRAALFRFFHQISQLQPSVQTQTHNAPKPKC